MTEDPCTWCAGYSDGYRVGPDGIDPAGQPVTAGYDEALMREAEYRRGLSVGRADRIDEQLTARYGADS
jgi:hypothetical protein